MKVGIFGNPYQATHLDELRGFLSWLAMRQYEVCVEAKFANYLITNGFDLKDCEKVASLPADTDIVASIGGDGTFLRASDWVGCLETPVMGINTGHLGYLAAYSFSDFQNIEAALEGNYMLSSRMTIEVESDCLPEGFSPVALNEVSISKGDTTSMVEIRASIDGRYIADYLADGLLVSTPTGSTAYNLSCGGPIIEPTFDSFVLSPIAPHSLTLRPLVVGPASLLEFQVTSRGSECHIGVDGRTFAIPSEGSAIRVRKAEHRVNVVQPLGSDFVGRLRSKLGWGG